MTPEVANTPVEARLLAAIIADDGVLDLCGDVEVEDFSDYRHRELFAAVRRLQHCELAVNVGELLDELERYDVEQGSFVSVHVDGLFLAQLLTFHCPDEDEPEDTRWIASGPKYYGEHALVEVDKQHLRTLAMRRAQLARAS